MWTGTRAEYDAITTKDENTLYNITDDTGSDSVLANTNLSNLTETGESHFANPTLTNSPYTTNRILEIPQDIKLELNDGTLTLKAGSKVYVPNGSGNFDIITTTSDFIADTSRYSGLYVLTVNATTGLPYNVTIIQDCVSGEAEPSSPTSLQGWYDITNNVIKRYNNGWQSHIHSFPLAFCTSDGTNITSIDQVFNGFGYIGSTVFALPGVKGLAPNGRDANRTCITEIKENTAVKVFHNTVSRSGITRLLLGDNAQLLTAYEWNDENNRIRNTLGNFNVDGVFVAAIFAVDSSSPYRITSFTPFTVDSVANSNASNFSQAGRSYLSGLGMPSSRYIDLTLGASDSTYTAPANGWFCINYNMTSITSFAGLKVDGHAFVINGYVQWNAPYIFPVKKGDNITVYYVNANATLFRFIYAEGEN